MAAVADFEGFKSAAEIAAATEKKAKDRQKEIMRATKETLAALEEPELFCEPVYRGKSGNTIARMDTIGLSFSKLTDSNVWDTDYGGGKATNAGATSVGATKKAIDKLIVENPWLGGLEDLLIDMGEPKKKRRIRDGVTATVKSALHQQLNILDKKKLLPASKLLQIILSADAVPINADQLSWIGLTVNVLCVLAKKNSIFLMAFSEAAVL